MIQNNMKAMRKLLGWHQQAVADMLGVPVYCVRQLEKETEPFSIVLAIRIAHLFGTTVNGIWERVPENGEPTSDIKVYDYKKRVGYNNKNLKE
jgi:DNA-binding XRE family transcriptional regulator